MAVCCEHDCAPVVAVNGELFCNLLSDCWLLKKNFTHCTELEMEVQLIGKRDAGRLYPNTVFKRCETCLFEQPFALHLAVQILMHGISSGSSCQAVRTISPATSIRYVSHFWGLIRDGELDLNGLMIAWVE